MEAVASNQGGNTSVRQAGVATSSIAPRLAGPDLLRAIAILLVMLWHLPRPARLPILQGLREYSWTGVDLFFVLSGYLIGTQLLRPVASGQPMALGTFYLKRCTRILPAFLFILCMYVLFPEISEGTHMQPLWRFVTFTMNFGLDYTATDTFTQAWSLCVEEHFYLLLPFLVLLLSSCRSRAPVVTLIVAVLLGGMLLRWVLWVPLGAAAEAQGIQYQFAPAYLKAIYYPTYCRLDGLLFGVLLAAYRCFYPEHWERYARPRTTLLLGLAMTILAVYLFHFPDRQFTRGPALGLGGAVLGYPLFSAGCACLLSASLRWEERFPRWRIPGATAIATISYSLYLSHKLTFHALQGWLDSEGLAGVRALVIYYGSSIVVAAVLWALIEKPPIVFRERLLKRRGAPRRNGAVGDAPRGEGR